MCTDRDFSELFRPAAWQVVFNTQKARPSKKIAAGMEAHCKPRRRKKNLAFPMFEAASSKNLIRAFPCRIF